MRIELLVLRKIIYKHLLVSGLLAFRAEYRMLYNGGFKKSVGRQRTGQTAIRRTSDGHQTSGQMARARQTARKTNEQRV